jgi:putative ABC transport system permease protein
VNLVLAGTGVKNCFSEEYDELVNAGKSAIEQQVMTEREEARYNQILGDAQEELDAAQQEMEDALSDAEEELADARQKLDDGWLALDQAEAELDAMEAVSPAPLDEARQELEESKQELEDGEQEYADGLAQYQEEKAEAEEKIEDARSKLSDISECEWYIRDRSALDGFSAISSDADCIESIGTVFPIMFLLVAILISLTTISRMVEEHRSLIGTYQALGFSNREIYQKFIVYSSVASLLGGMVGNFGGYIILPEIVIVIFRTMYQLPTYYIGYDFLFGIGGIALFYIAIVGTTIWCCRSTVRQKPSTLMRPKAPKAGSRILLEYISPLWRRLSFLNKVTARNLFRYKKRFLMTVFGIAGCTALLLCGFSIKDTVADLLPRQYEQVISYDVLAVTAGGEDFQVMEEYLKEETEQLASSLPMEITTVDVKNESGDTLSVQLYVIPEGGNLTDFLTLETTEGEPVDIRADGCYLTENIGTMLGISKGASVTLQDMSLKEANGTVNGMIQYYLGNAIFMTESYYEAIFGEYEPNAMVLCLAEDSDEADFVRQLKQREEILSVTSVQELKDGFSQSFALMNMVVYVIIVLAGALAFVVLFTLSTTNISERERELATIKVLGFFDREVHWYVNKETVILTVIGILVGLPLGVLLSNLLGVVLRIPAVVYSTTIHKVSYVLAGGMALLFALLVDTTTNRVLNRIHPVEALKSVE